MSPTDKINILVVDDMPDKLLAMQAILEDLGQNVVTVQSGRDALRQLLDREFAVILLDVNMPDMNGFETASLIRQRKKSEGTPIIFITAFSDETHAWQGYSLGAVDYILAPVVPEVLRTKVGVFVDLYRKTLQVQEQAEERVTLIREQAARLAAEAMTQRMAYLSDASNQLARSLDYEATTSTLMHLVIPRLADVAGLLLLDEHTEQQRCEVCWRGQLDRNVAHVTLTRDELPSMLVSLIDEVLRAGKTRSVEEVTFDQPAAIVLQNTSTTLTCPVVTILPLIARGKTIGVLWLGDGLSTRTAVDVSLAESLANRAAIAIDNARLYREIQEGDRRKDEFLAMLGHELRNPLAAISNALECLPKVLDDPSFFQELQRVLERQSRQMSRLVDDLLDVSRITRGKIELRKEIVDLASIVQRTIAATSPTVSARSHQLSLSLPEGRLPVLVDPTRLEQVLSNLVNNAAKYTDRGGTINIIVERDRQEFKVRIVDNGIGISADLLPHVFELFTQGDRSLDRSQGGLGIGLTLVQRLVELHGGHVAVKSKGLYQGAEFIVSLPEVRHADTEKTNGSSGNGESPVRTRRRVLVVDDNEDLAFTVSTLLRAAGHEVQAVGDGPATFEIVNTWNPEVVLIDIGLPGIDGYEVARRLRNDFDFSQLLIAITGYGQQEDRERSQRAGFDHHLVKPVEFATLQKLLISVPEAGLTHSPRDRIVPAAS